MFLAKTIPAEHRDLIHDVAYDYHGRRMATCSSDQYVKIWDLVDGDWKCTASWKTHAGSVWRVTWAHPEFGQVIATCSFDRTTAIWEELPGEAGDCGQWVKRGNLVDSRTSVTDVKFAPKHMGLQLASCSSDGVLRIYEAPDVMNLSQWTLQHEIHCKLPLSCLSWNPSRVHPPMIAIGSDEQSAAMSGRVQIYEYSDTTRKWTKVETIVATLEPVRDIAFSPNLGRSYHLLAVASKDVTIFTIKPVTRKDLPVANTTQPALSKFEIRHVGQFGDHQSQVWRLSWNVAGTILASSGDDGCVRLWKANYMDTWKCIAVLKGDGSDTQHAGQLAISQGSSLSTSENNPARFTQLSSMASANQVVWH